MPGLIGKKIGMTSISDENGNNMPCTILEVGPCVVTQIKTKEKIRIFRLPVEIILATKAMP